MPILVLINNIKRPTVHHDVYKRKTKNFVVEDFLTEVAMICNNFVRVCDQTPTLPVNMLFDNFLFQLEYALNKHAPLRRLSRQEKKNKVKTLDF